MVLGAGIVQIGPAEASIEPHDHFGVPAGLEAYVKQVGDEPLTMLDTVIRERQEAVLDHEIFSAHLTLCWSKLIAF